MNHFALSAPGRTVAFACAAALICLFTLQGCGSKTISGVNNASYSTNTSIVGFKVAETALRQQGIRYRSGGASPKSGFDCSGLISWSYAQHGIRIPRVTTDQARIGRAVPRDQLRPGDIVVFKAKDAPNGLHTGLYTSNGNFVHSPNSRSKVRVENINNTHWKKTYLMARRVLR